MHVIKLPLLALFLLLKVLLVSAQTAADTVQRIPEVVITGNFPAYLQAIEQQRQAAGIVSVLRLDLPGRFPDLNPAEALQRLPGIVVQRSEGEGRFVHVRGADPALTTIQVNGEQIISPEAHSRFLQFDLLPVDQLSAVEVWKTNRPDQDGDAIGGSINLITRQPKQHKPRWLASAAGGFNPAAGLPNGQAQLAYAGNNLLLNASYWQDHRATDNLETLYGQVDATEELTISDLELRHLDVARRRMALSGEYRLPFRADHGFAYLRGLFTDFLEKSERQRLRYRPGRGEVIPGTDTVFAARIGRDVQNRRETERFAVLQSGFERQFNRLKIEASVAYSSGLEAEPEGRELDFKLLGVDLQRTNANAAFPQYQVVNGEAADLYDHFVLNELETESDRSTDQALTGKINARWSLPHPGNYLQVGFKARQREKRSRSAERVYDEYNGQVPFQLSTLLAPGVRNFLHDRYTFGQRIQWAKAQSVINDHFNAFQINAPETALGSTAGNFNINENTAATYALIHFERGAWTWLAGARLEYTDYRYAADQTLIDSLGVNTRPLSRVFTDHYAFLLPSLQAKYLAPNGLRWQAAASASYARPSFEQLAPYELFNQLDGDVLAGNPNLRPAFAWNLDLAVEKPLAHSGSCSATLFAKRIENFIFDRQSRDSRLWGGTQVDVLTTVPLNGERAYLGGLELAWQQQLAFLPDAWSGLGVFANYTYTWSQASAEEEETGGGEAEESFRLPGQATHSGNLALWYDHKRWSGRVALNIQSDFLLRTAEPEDAESRLIYGGSAQLEATVGYTLAAHVTLFGEGMNLLNTPLRYFTGDRDHPSKLEYYGAWGRVGLKIGW